PCGTSHGLDAAAAGLDEIDRLEDQLTVYREHSEMCRLNRLAATEAVAIEEGLYGLLDLAARISRETGGAYDITSGALIKSWGFFRRCGRVPTARERAEVMERV